MKWQIGLLTAAAFIGVTASSPGVRANNRDGARQSSEAEKLELVRKATDPWNAVSRWLIEYEATPSAVTKGSLSVHRIMAVSASGDFHQLTAHFGPTYPWQTDPYCQEYFINQGKTCHKWRFLRAYSEGRLKIGDAMPESITEDVLLTVIPRWPLIQYRMPAGISGLRVIAAEALRSADYRLLSGSDSITGEDCAIFDRNGIDRIWIATNKGLCVMRREIRDARSGRLLQRILAEKVVEVAPGLWLPKEFRSQFFSVSHERNKDVIEREGKVRILRCKLNDEVPESTFIPVHRPGSIKYENKNRFTQVSAGGEDLLDEIVDFMVKYAGLPTKPIPHIQSYIWFVAGVAIGLCGGFLVLPRKKKRLMNRKSAEPESRKIATAVREKVHDTVILGIHTHL